MNPQHKINKRLEYGTKKIKSIKNFSTTPFSQVVDILQKLQFTEFFVEKFNSHKRFHFYPMFFTLITWMNQGIKNINSLFCPIEGIQYPIEFKKSCLYNKLASTSIDWSSLVHSLMMAIASYLMKNEASLSDCFIVIDDSLINRDRSKKIELGTNKLHYHNTGKYSRGFSLLQLGLSMGKYFVPLAFELFGTTNDQYRIKEQRKVDKRTKAGRRRKKAQTSKPQLVLDMLAKFKNSKFAGLIIFCETWFTSPNFIKNICSMGFELISMHRENDIKYTTVDGREITIKNELYEIQKAIKQGESFGQIAKSIQVYVEQGDGARILCKIVFAKDWMTGEMTINH